MTRLSADDIRVHRSGNGPALVMLHCLGVDHRFWDEAAAGLGASRTVLRYDFPGHHETPVPKVAFSVEDLSAQLRDVLDREGVGSAAVAGISLGGLVAQHFAATFPERTERVILCDTTPRYTDAMRSGWHDRAATARTRGVSVMTDTLLNVWFTPAFVAADPPQVRYVRDCFARVAGEGYAKACEALAGADLRSLLPRIKAPTLVVCGNEDVPDFLVAARDLQGAMPNARLEWLSPRRHAPTLEEGIGRASCREKG